MATLRKRSSTNSSGESQRSMNEATSVPPPPTASAGDQHAAATAPLSIPRAALRALALRASHNPIEVIVSIFVVVTLAYFQLVHALTTSNFFEPLSREASGMAAASTWSGASGRAVAFWNPTPSNAAGTPVRQGSVLVRKANQQHWTPVTQIEQINSVITSITNADDSAKAPLRFVVEPLILADAQTQPAPILDTIARKLFTQLLAEPEQSRVAAATTAQSIEPFAIKDPSSGLVGYGFGRVSSFSRQFWNERQRTLQRADDEDLLGTIVTESLAEAAAANATPSRGTSTNASKRANSRASNKFGRQVPATPADVVNSEDVQLLAIFPDADLHDFFTAGGESDEVRSVRWLGYALWALVMRFWALLKRADSADIFVMLSAYLLMHGTFVNLFLSMRRFGSNFWLGASVLTSSICAFLCALTMAYLLGVTVDPICLSEALPFLVITVGFEKPFLLTKAVFTHNAIAPQTTAPNEAHPSLLLSALNDSQQAVQRQRQQESAAAAAAAALNTDRSVDVDTDFSKALAMRDVAVSQEESFVRALTARLKSEPSLRWSAPQPVPAKEVVVAAVDAVGMQIVRDYAVEIAVMAVGATSGVSGLREFCQLAALILVFDCAFLFAFLVATLTIMVEVHRIKVMRGMKRVTPSTPPNVDSDVPVSSDASPPSERVSPTTAGAAGRRNSSPDSVADEDDSKTAQRHPRPLWRKVVKLLLGKVPFEPERPGARENPVARLKLLLVTTFLTLHSLNLVSTLTTQSAITRHHSTDGPTLYQAVQDSSVVLQAGPSSSLIAPMLASLIKTQPANVDLFVKVQDPITFVLTRDNGVANVGSSMLGEVALNASNNGGQVNADLTSSLAAHLGGRSAHAGITRSANASGRASLNVLDSFMSGWTVIVGDPVISKWISLALVISIFLNAFLLKGIATGNAAIADGNAAGAAAFAAARMIGSHLTRQQEASKGADTLNDGKSDARRESSTDRLSQYHRNLAKSASTHTQKSRESTLDAGGKKPTTDDGGSNENVTPQQPTHERFPTTLSLNGVSSDETAVPRAYEEILDVYSDGAGVLMLSDEELILLVQKGKVAGYSLEKALQDNERAVRIRRATISRASLTQTLEHSLVPLRGYDYAQVMGACCENVVGFMPLPLGIAGPLLIDGLMTPIPMATTEGTLVASTSRGCKALNAAGGVTTVLTQDAMTRGPAVEFPSITQAAKAKRWIDSPDGAATIKEAFDSTSRFARLASLRCVMAGRTLYIRFATSTGDAMGMNMVSKGVEKALACMSERFDMTVLSLSGNYCIDKKPSAINWIEGRGKSVCCEAVIPGKTVKGVLKTSVEDLVNLNLKKNLIGSAMAGSIGGFNAHAANIVAAVFLACGQDPAQVVESSMCITLMEAIPSKHGGRDEPDLLVTVSMPSIEVGTVGGGTILSPQRAMLDMLGVAGSSKDVPGANAQRLARIIAAAVMAGELSLMGALSAGHLIAAHMKHNRSVPPTPGNVTPTSSGSINGSLFGMAMAQTPLTQHTAASARASGGESTGTPARFQSPMTPLIAPPVGSGPQSRGSPSNTLSAKDRRSASAM